MLTDGLLNDKQMDVWGYGAAGPWLLLPAFNREHRSGQTNKANK